MTITDVTQYEQRMERVRALPARFRDLPVLTVQELNRTYADLVERLADYSGIHEDRLQERLVAVMDELQTRALLTHLIHRMDFNREHGARLLGVLVDEADDDVLRCFGATREALLDNLHRMALADEQQRTLALLDRQATVQITAVRARNLLRIVVAAYGRGHSIGDNPCAYFWNGKPRCIVGVALHLAGVTEDELRAMDRQEPTEIGPGLVVLPARVWMSDAARRVFAAAQDAQDHGSDRAGLSWGEALDAALAVHPYQRTAVSA
ncbi:hypothetical protein [Kibdelosporangium phytohabitans]|uniref:Uncharacterized protein n=1 Tax=Kibdelosporangium phytohabitans TaxID=860235 RepID=A0A0N9HXK6_9PSEU|nr:hypothetical protein [Kibdelosporangium phytohabitans]ALG06816.1 hypothetical protein AOZ06_07640 [Kibdelosporangium phytohabitans]MBE1468059.1 hypothetical protein [Kibdelosporangium phytohabitans]